MTRLLSKKQVGALKIGVAGVLVAVLVLLPSTALASSPPILSWSPTTGSGVFDFGTIAPGQAVSVQFRLTNIGRSSTSALSTTLTGSTAFTITSNACSLASLSTGRSCDLTVRYAPTVGGSSDIGTLSATGRKPAASASLSLRGASVLPRQIYWSTTNDTMARANIDGSGTNLNLITGPFGEYGVALDATHLFWVSVPFGIGRSDLDGQNINPTFVSAAGLTFGVDVDSAHVYWPHTDPNPALTGISRADIDGQNANPSFITGTTDPFDVAVDSSHIYWADCTANAIGRADLDGQNANPSFITGASCPVGVAVDGQHVYWTNSGSSSIGRADLSGGNVNQSLISTGPFPFAIALDSTYIYWTDDATGAIGRADLNGGSVNQGFIANAMAGRGIAVQP